MPLTCVGASVGLSDLPSLIPMSILLAGTVVAARRTRAPVELLEEPRYPFPDLGAAGEAAPARADQSDERVAVVDRHDPVPARAAHAVHEQRLDVGLERREPRVGRPQ